MSTIHASLILRSVQILIQAGIFLKARILQYCTEIAFMSLNTHPLRLGSFKERGVHLLLRLDSSEDRSSNLFSDLAVLFETKPVFVKSCSILTPEKSIVFKNIFNSIYRDMELHIGYLLVCKLLVANF